MIELPTFEDYRSRPPDPARREGGMRHRLGIGKQSMTSSPLVSIITVVRNGANTLERTILSVLNQGYTNIEYIVIDGASTDTTLDIIRTYEDRIDYWMSEPDYGIYDAMNKGIVCATGEVIGLLNADDTYTPDAIESLVQAYDGASGTSVYYGDRYYRYIYAGMKKRMKADLDRLLYTMSIHHQALFIPRAVYQARGLYSTRYRFTSDYCYLLQLYLDGARFEYLNFVVCNFGNEGASYTYFFRVKREIIDIQMRLKSPRRFRVLLFILKECMLYFCFKGLQKLVGTSRADALRSRRLVLKYLNELEPD